MWPFSVRRATLIRELISGTVRHNGQTGPIGDYPVPKDVVEIVDNRYPREEIGKLFLFDPAREQDVWLTCEEAYRRAYQVKGYFPAGINEAGYLLSYRLQIPKIKGVLELHFPGTRGRWSPNYFNDSVIGPRWWTPLLWRSNYGQDEWREYSIRSWSADARWELCNYGKARIVLVQVAP